MKVKNKYTGEVLKVLRIEDVPVSPGETVKVYVLEGEDRWAADLLWQYWVKVIEEA